MGKSKIEWTDATWNPVRGCVKVSPGCKHCYAEAFAERFRGVPGHAYERGFDPRLAPDKLGDPLRWQRPRMVFVNSMSDLFGDFVPDEYIAAVFGVMAACPQHTFQVLTKRAERMREWFKWIAEREKVGAAFEYCIGEADDHVDFRDQMFIDAHWPLPNVWLGVSAENQEYADERIPNLLATPAAVRFVSAEPLLGPVDFSPWLPTSTTEPAVLHTFSPDAKAAYGETGPDGLLVSLTRTTIGLDWVVVGGESGSSARPFDLAWARSIVAQCGTAGVPCFVKQLGARPCVTTLPEWDDPIFGGKSWRSATTARDGKFFFDLSDKKGGDQDEWPAGLRVRQWPVQTRCRSRSSRMRTMR